MGSSATNILWLKADGITGLSDGGAVGTWTDESGNSNSFTQSTASKKPTWDQVNASFNNKSTVYFDGTDDFLDYGDGQMSAAGNYSIFFIYKSGDNSKRQYLFDTKTGTLTIPHDGTGNEKAYNDGAQHGVSLNGTNTKLVLWQLNSAGAGIFEDGTQTQSGLAYTQRAINNSTSLGANEIGNNRNFIGDIAEGIIFNSTVNSAQRIIVENYLGNKYGLSIGNDKYAYQSGYENDIAGIGREDASNEHTAAQSAKIFKVSSASSLGNGDYLLFGHDAGSIASWTTSERPNAEVKRIAREWRLDETGDVGTITITMDTATLPAHASGYSGYVVMIDGDGDFSSGAKIYTLASAGGSTYNITGVDINDGDYVTFGCARNVYKSMTGNFNVAGNWLCGSVPGSAALAVISTGAIVTLSNSPTVGELIIVNGGTVDLSSYSISIDNTTITNNGTLTMSIGTVNFCKAGNQNIPSFTYYNLTISGSGTKTLTANTTVNGNLTLSAGTLDVDNSNNYSLTVKGNFINSATFTARSGSVTLSGSSNQAITSNGSSFYNLTVNNTSTQITLNDNLTVSNLLVLTDGVITTGASYRVLISSTSASALSGYSSASFINGNLRRNITSNTGTYGFPVGNGTGTSNYYLAEMVNGNLSGITYIDSKFKALTGHNDSELNVWDNWQHGYLSYNTINTAGVWELEPNTSPSGGTYSVKLYIANMSEFTDNKFGPLKRPIGSTSGADWTTGGGSLNNNDTPGRTVASGYMQRNGLTSFSDFGGGGGSGGGAGLPIELLSFKAKTDGKVVYLNWVTATENNNNFFTTERSLDGVTFDKLLEFEGAGFSSITREYATVDRNPYIGTSYYRLRQTDYNGNETVSHIVSVYVPPSKVVMTISPNPINDKKLLINIENAGQDKVSAFLFVSDLNGRIVFTHDIEIKDAPLLQVDLPDAMNNGLYFVNIQHEGIISRFKLMVN